MIRLILLFLFVFASHFAFSLNVGKFKRKLNSPPPSWMVAQIRKDLEPFKEGIKEKSIQAVYDRYSYDPLALMCEIHNKHVKFQISEKELSQYAFRKLMGPGYLLRYLTLKRVISFLAKNKLVPSMKLAISMHDGMGGQMPGPIFSFAKCKHSNVINLPDFEAIIGYSVLNKEVFKANADFPYDQKENKAFWRGATTGGKYSPSNWDTFPRAKLALFSIAHPSLIDAKFTTITDHIDEMKPLFETKGLLSDRVSIYDHVKYKYLVDVDGHSCTYSRMYWILLSNSVCLKQISENEQWYYLGLKPYEHYIPLKPDLSDIQERLAWAIIYPEKCKKIAQAATEFALANLQKEDVYLYIYLLLNEYAKLLM